jgi:hypothetical protein
MRKADRIWRRSFFTRAIAFRYLLTPIGTIKRCYTMSDGALVYLDIYVFGIRIARIHR